MVTTVPCAGRGHAAGSASTSTTARLPMPRPGASPTWPPVTDWGRKPAPEGATPAPEASAGRREDDGGLDAAVGVALVDGEEGAGGVEDRPRAGTGHPEYAAGQDL